MTGQQLFQFLANNLQMGQVIHVSNNGSLYKFNTVLHNTILRFTVPNKLYPNRTNYKYINQIELITAREIYNQQNHHLDIDKHWIKQNLNSKWDDCTIALLINLLGMPEYLKG